MVGEDRRGRIRNSDEGNLSSSNPKETEKKLQFENDAYDDASKCTNDYVITDKDQQYSEPEEFDIVVEYASDCESCDDSLRSIWRNRRPSPGQWMEPVDAFL